MITIQVLSNDTKTQKIDANRSKKSPHLLIEGIFENDPLKSSLLKSLKNQYGFKTKFLTFQKITPLSEQPMLIVGLGPNSKDNLTHEKMRLLGSSIFNESKNFETITINFPWLKLPELAQALLEGILLTGQTTKTYQTKPKKEPDFIFFIKAFVPNLEQIIKKVHILEQAVSLTREWSNAPANIGTASYYAKNIQQLAKKWKIKCTVIDKKEQMKQKMGLFLGVNQGSPESGTIVVLEYTPKNAKKSVGLVGKGITFDSGGISIKPSLKMEEMKHDMTGAATIIASTFAAAQLKSPHRIVAVAAFTDNIPGTHAQVPSSVQTSRSGKTVEIINTDAEGRLILGDALDLIQDYQVDQIIDLATLTGAVGIALGKVCAAILGNNQPLIQKLQKIGEKTQELLWQLPLHDQYFEDLRSEIADMRNANNDSYGGTIKAAIFLKQFIKKNLPWAHLDIAATAYNITHLSHVPKKGASGQFVRLLTEYLLEKIED